MRARLGAPVWLPRRRPRALAVEARDSSGELERLQRAVVRVLGADAPDRGAPARRFRAHITVARTRGGRPPGDGMELPATPRLGFLAREVVLYRSWLEPQGARYERVADAPLSESGG